MTRGRSNWTWSIAILAALLSCAPPVAAQPAPTGASGPITIEQIIDDLVEQAVRRARVPNANTPFTGTVDDSNAGPILTLLADITAQNAEARQAYDTLANMMLVRSDTQIGSAPGSSGSTSLAMKGLVPALLGFALEHGAIAREIDGTVATFRVSPAGVVRALQGRGLLDIYKDYSQDATFRFASRFSAAVSFDTSRGGTPNTVLANDQQLSAWSINVMLLNRRDPRAKGYASQWRDVALKSGPAYIEARTALRDALRDWAPFTAWQKTLVARVAREVEGVWRVDRNTLAAGDRMRAILEEHLPQLETMPTPEPAVNAAMATYIAQLSEVVRARNNLYEYARKGAVATFDWTTTRDPMLPDLYTLTGIFEASFLRSRTDNFSANAAFNVYRDAPAGSDRRYKSFVLSAEWDRPLGRVLEIPFIVSAAARYEHIPEDIAVPGSGMDSMDGGMTAGIAPRGNLVVAQAKLTVPLKTGVRIPFSVTWANRTELIEEREVRANFGVTFNLDAFIAAARSRP